jgi:hypothetical protein
VLGKERESTRFYEYIPCNSVNCSKLEPLCLKHNNIQLLSQINPYEHSVLSPISIGPPNITSLYEHVQRAGNIQDIMAVSNFLNPVEERELESEEQQELNPDEFSRYFE